MTAPHPPWALMMRRAVESETRTRDALGKVRRRVRSEEAKPEGGGGAEDDTNVLRVGFLAKLICRKKHARWVGCNIARGQLEETGKA